MKIPLANRLSFLILFNFLYQTAFSQDTVSSKVDGYLKSLQLFSFTDNADSVYVSSYVHNRINYSWHAGKYFTWKASARNLIYAGEIVKYTPFFSKAVSQDNGYFNLSILWMQKRSFVALTKFDRINATWNFEKGYMTFGRQRINWGVNTIWNPNDLFNTFNFLDFDYEERPGSDAIRFSYNTSTFSNLEIAISPARIDSAWIGALKYGFNKEGYDIQLLAGNYRTDIVLGIGFAGNIGQAGWKGELTYFQPRNNLFETTGNLSASSGIDYGFSNGWYLNGSFLFNSAAPDRLSSLDLVTSLQLSPKVLMPAKWNFLIQAMQNFSPLISGNFSIVYSPSLNLLILLPYISYSIAENWDLDLNIQTFFAENFNNKFKILRNHINLRLKWTY